MPQDSTFDDHVKQHMATYKREVLGVLASGMWRGQEYPHILPSSLRARNILDPYREEFWAYFDRLPSARRIKLHEGFHHLNSSQALCFNLFGPFVLSKDFRVLLKALNLGKHAPVASAEFEHVPDRGASEDKKEGTSFDFFMEFDGGDKCYFEIKYTEGEFGAAKADDRHRAKLKDIYRGSLNGKVKKEYLDDEILFFKNYQILRNLSYLGQSSHVVFVIPEGNGSLRPGLKGAITESCG